MDYDPRWPELFAREAARIRQALDTRVLRLEHLGSTAVPVLAARPVIDLLLVVTDSANEDDLSLLGKKSRPPVWEFPQK